MKPLFRKYSKIALIALLCTSTFYSGCVYLLRVPPTWILTSIFVSPYPIQALAVWYAEANVDGGGVGVVQGSVREEFQDGEATRIPYIIFAALILAATSWFLIRASATRQHFLDIEAFGEESEQQLYAGYEWTGTQFQLIYAYLIPLAILAQYQLRGPYFDSQGNHYWTGLREGNVIVARLDPLGRLVEEYEISDPNNELSNPQIRMAPASFGGFPLLMAFLLFTVVGSSIGSGNTARGLIPFSYNQFRNPTIFFDQFHALLLIAPLAYAAIFSGSLIPYYNSMSGIQDIAFLAAIPAVGMLLWTVFYGVGWQGLAYAVSNFEYSGAFFNALLLGLPLILMAGLIGSQYSILAFNTDSRSFTNHWRIAFASLAIPMIFVSLFMWIGIPGVRDFDVIRAVLRQPRFTNPGFARLEGGDNLEGDPDAVIVDLIRNDLDSSDAVGLFNVPADASITTNAGPGLTINPGTVISFLASQQEVRADIFGPILADPNSIPDGQIGVMPMDITATNEALPTLEDVSGMFSVAQYAGLQINSEPTNGFGTFITPIDAEAVNGILTVTNAQPQITLEEVVAVITDPEAPLLKVERIDDTSARLYFQGTAGETYELHTNGTLPIDVSGTPVETITPASDGVVERTIQLDGTRQFWTIERITTE